MKIIDKFCRRKQSTTVVEPLIRQQSSLQPMTIKKDDSSYSTVLDLAYRLEKQDATNIALTGPYGSGKSTILETLKNDFPTHKYLNISLATLNAHSDSKNKQECNDACSQLIEYSILQQLIYREDYGTLKNSRFQIINRIGRKKQVKYSIGIILAIVSLIIIFEPKFLCVPWIIDLFDNEICNIVFDSLCIVYLSVFLFFVVTFSIQALNNKKINNISIADGGLEISDSMSVFNKHLDEILYFFQQTQYDVVLIEDLDRFDNVEIFLKLKELNFLLNTSKTIRRKIIFIYAVRDDLFSDSERVKCFDYMTSVVPIINKSNSKNKLKEELANRGVDNVSDTDLKEIGFFIDDMRLLKNIVNEYVQYKDKLPSKIKFQNLLAIIVYKNYYPQDFVCLHNCKGLVYNLIIKKQHLMEQISESVKQKLQKSKEKRQEIIDTPLWQDKELRAVYMSMYLKHINAIVYDFIVENKQISYSDLIEKGEEFDKFIKQKSVKYRTSAYNYYGNVQHTEHSMDVSFDNIQNQVNPKLTYWQRLQSNRASLLESAQETIDKYSSMIEDIKSQSLMQLLSNEEANKNEFFKPAEKCPMIQYFIMKGYIDENYYDYISYFYENMISQHDWEFILDLKIRKPHAYDYPINDVSIIAQEISNDCYRDKSILNIILLDYMAEHANSDELCSEKMSFMLNEAINNKKLDFLTCYYNNGKYPSVAFQRLFELQKGLWYAFASNEDETLMLIWFLYAEEKLNNKNSKKWLENNFSFITDNISKFDLSYLKKLISKYKYHFKEINSNSYELIEFVTDNSCFELNPQTVSTIMKYYLKEDISEEGMSYTSLVSVSNKSFNDYINDNLDSVLTTVFAKSNCKQESTESINYIICADNVDEATKLSYLKGQENHIDLAGMYSDDYYQIAIKCGVVNPTWTNVYEYIQYQQEHVTKELVEYIAMYAQQLSEMDFEKVEIGRYLCEKLLLSNDLDIKTYTQIASHIKGLNCSKMSYEKLEDERMLILIDNRIISFSDDNTSFIQNNYSSNVLLEYLTVNKKLFRTRMNTIQYETDIAINLLQSKKFNLNEKLTIVKLLKKSALDEKLSNIIVKDFADYAVEIDFSFVKTLLKLSTDTENKVLMVCNSLLKYQNKQEYVSVLLSVLPSPYSNIAYNKNPTIYKTNINTKFVVSLREIGYISSYKIANKEKIKVYTKKHSAPIIKELENPSSIIG